jgi:hypothetical protein
LDEDEIESFLPFDVCAERGCHIHLNSEDTGRELFRAKYYCESCYSKRRASCIIDSMSQKDAYGVTEAISIF